jgi:hypothetical protein
MSDSYPNGARMARELHRLKLNDGPPMVLYTIKTDGTEFKVTAAFAMNPLLGGEIVDRRIETLEAQLKASASRIEALEAGIDEPCTSDCRRRIDNLKAKYAAALGKVNELRAGGNDKWELYKADIWIAWNDLENAFSDF